MPIINMWQCRAVIMLQAEELLEDTGDVAAALNLHYNTDVYTADGGQSAAASQGKH